MISNSKWFLKLGTAFALCATVAFTQGCGDDPAAVVAAFTCTDGLIREDVPVEGIISVTGCLDGDEDGTDDGELTFEAALDTGVAPRYLLAGVVFVGDDVNQTILNIEPGAVIIGDSGAVPGTLVIRRGSKLMAEGTAGNPIVMTSAQDPGSRAPGDWGGLVINGRAPINGCTSGVCTAEGEGGTGEYGGNVPTDNSGVIQYVRVEFAGKLFSPDNELNGIAFQGVGSGTTIDHIQVHRNADDGVEFFGGTANAKYVLITGAQDDSLDWTDGWVGNLQHVILQQRDDTADQGIEADNNGENNLLTPISLPTISNITIISVDEGDIGILLREGTGVHLHNVLLLSSGDGWSEGGIDIDHEATFANSTVANDGNLTIDNSVFVFSGAGSEFLEEGGDGFDISTWFDNGTNNLNTADTPDADLMDPFDINSPDFRLAGGTDDDDIDNDGVQPAGAFFDAVTHIGGMGTTDWTAPWAAFPAN